MRQPGGCGLSQGRIDRDQIPGVLRELDVLVVPSIWWENSPLVIHEAFAAGVPVLCSGIGGMADMVADDVSGWHFPPGDHRALRVLLARLIDDPQQLERLKQGIPRVKTMVQDAEFHEELFERVVSSHEEWSAMEEESLLADELFDVDWPED